MALFRRAKAPAIDPNVGTWGFWRWWTAEGADQMAAWLDSPGQEAGSAITERLTRRVAGVDPRLTWSLAPGVNAKHRLIVSANGNPELLFIARRWLRRAPDASRLWEYADQRPAVAQLVGHTIDVDGIEVSLDDITATWARRGDWLDVRLHHPLFAGHLDEINARIAAHVLDAVVGERDADLWVGRVTHPRDGQPAAAPVEGIRAAVRDLRTELTDHVGKPIWTTFSGMSNGRPVTAAALVKLTPALAPQLDFHVNVVVPFVDLNTVGEPSEMALRQLNALVAALEDRLGRSTLLVAHETARGHRTLHFYVDSMTSAGEQIKAAFVEWRQGKVKSDATADPHWSIVGHLRR